MKLISNADLIAMAAAVIKARRLGGFLVGDVGAALVTDKGNVYIGTCVDTSGMGICAEQSAIAAMLAAGEDRVRKIVAVWKDEHGKPFVISPCGHCREMMRQVCGAGGRTEVILSKTKAVRLETLLPLRNSWKKV